MAWVQPQQWLCHEHHLPLSWQRCDLERLFPAVTGGAIGGVPVPLTVCGAHCHLSPDLFGWAPVERSTPWMPWSLPSKRS